MGKLFKCIVFLSLALTSISSMATPQFTYNGGSYPSLIAAERAMRAYNQSKGGEDLFKCPETPNLTTIPGGALYDYCLNRKSAADLNRGGYWAGWTYLNHNFSCSPSGSPANVYLLQQTYPPCHKDNLQDLLQAFSTWFYQAYASQCDLEPPTLTGSFADPVGHWTDPLTDQLGGTYSIAYGDNASHNVGIRIRWRVCSQSNVSENVVSVHREYAYACPSGYQIRNTPEVPVAEWPRICRAFPVALQITSNLPPPANSCPRSGHPCVPGTGEKLLSEPDFEWSGLVFRRTYRSLGGFDSKSKLGEQWWHSWGERLFVPASASASVFRYNDKGDYEEYKPVSGVPGQYRPLYSHERFLEKQADGRFFLTDGAFVSVVYDSAGRVVEAPDRESPQSSLTFGYDSASRLGSVTNGLGQSLHFVYEDAHYADPTHASGWVPDRLMAIEDEEGVSLVSYSYDASGRMTAATRRDGVARNYVYGESDHLCEGGAAGCTASTYSGYITGIVAEDGTRFSDYHYDGNGRVVHVVEAAGANDTTLTYISDTKTTMARTGMPSQSYTFDTSMYRRPVTIQTPKGTVTYQYDPASAWVKVTDERGITTRYDYDLQGRRTSLTEALGLPEQRTKVTTIPTPTSQVLSVETRNSNGTAIKRDETEYGELGFVVRSATVDSASSASRSIEISRCTLAEIGSAQCPIGGVVKSINGPRTDVSDLVTYSYRYSDHPDCATDPVGCPYRKGALWKITNGLGQTVEYLSYNFLGRPTSVIDINGVVTDYGYTSRGWISSVKVRGVNNASEADDMITTFDYWPTGLLKEVLSPGGSMLSFAYDGAMRLTDVVDGSGNTMHFDRNATGKITRRQIKDAQNVLRSSISRSINAFGEVESVTDAYGRSTTFTYDAASHVDQSKDALDRISDNNYDGIGRLSRVLQDLNGIAAETKFAYDALDNLVQMNDPNLLNTTYTYNGFSDLRQLASPDTGTTTYTYDSAGNRVSRTDARSKVANYTYDALNRLIGVSYPTASTLDTTYIWDTAQAACQTGETFTAGRLAKIVDGSGNTVYCYDRFGHIVRKLQTTDGNVFTLLFAWNAAGQLISTTYPDGAIVDYVYDTQGRVSEIGAKTSAGTRQVLVTNVNYHPFGPASDWRYGSSGGRMLARTLNQNYQPGVVQDTDTGGLSMGYEFDEVGNLKKLRDGNQAEPPQRIYGYDALNRLTQTQDGNTLSVLEGYTYDKIGNRTSATVSGVTTNYTYPGTSHQLSSVGSNGRTYDANGNTTQVVGLVTKNFVYGDHNRMTQAQENATVMMNYVYNGRGEQVHRYLSTTNTYAIYDEAGHWLGDYGNTGATAPIQQAIWFGDLPVGVFVGVGTSQKLYYVESDALDTPRVVIDPTRGATGTAVWKWDLAGEAFGTTAPNQDPDGDATQFVFNLRFPGQRYDAASGLNYNYFRDYDVVTGRYMESDPIGLLGGVSTFGYARGNPILFSDSRGLVVVYIGGTGAGYLGLLAGTGSGGLIFDSTGGAATYTTGGAGLAIGEGLSFGLSAGILASESEWSWLRFVFPPAFIVPPSRYSDCYDETKIADFAGQFRNLSFDVAAGPDVGGDFFIDPHNKSHYGGGFTFGGGLAGGVSSTISNTIINPITLDSLGM